MLIFCTLLYMVFAFIDVTPLVKNKQWKVLIIYSAIITTAYTFTVLTELGIKIPSPSNPLKNMIMSIVGK